MRNLKTYAFWGLFCGLLFTACVKESGSGSTIASQVTGDFVSSAATVMVDEEMLVENASDYTLTITEVDANTVSVITEHMPAFEVDLVKSDNGELTTGKASSADSGFTFAYQVSEQIISINYKKDGMTMNFEGAKE